MNKLLTITGPTACGKTSLAARLALKLDGEIISADSRQVFRGMDIGTGKDLDDYRQDGVDIPYHIIDIHEAGYEYNVYQFQYDFIGAYNQIVSCGKQPILCGGTGMYVESIVKGYQLPDAPIDYEYRKSLETFSDEELTCRLAAQIKLHNHTDTETRDRLVRALEIQEFHVKNPGKVVQLPPMEHVVVALEFPREIIVNRIELRLRQRLQQGMVDEVQGLLDRGVPEERLLKYGLEYRHVTRFLKGECSYDEMFDKLFTDIRRFAKRQMTWFRRMERNGVCINWIDGQLSMEDKVDEVLSLMR